MHISDKNCSMDLRKRPFKFIIKIFLTTHLLRFQTKNGFFSHLLLHYINLKIKVKFNVFIFFHEIKNYIID